MAVKRAGALIPVALCSVVLIGCGDFQETNASANVLSVSEAKEALHELPYRYKFRSVPLPKGAEGAIAGRAYGPHKTVLNFGIALGVSPEPVPVPRAGVSESYGYPDGGFLLTDDLNLRKVSGALVPTKTLRQWRQAGHMEVEITDKLCLAATGDHCPV